MESPSNSEAAGGVREDSIRFRIPSVRDGAAVKPTTHCTVHYALHMNGEMCVVEGLIRHGYCEMDFGRTVGRGKLTCRER